MTGKNLVISDNDQRRIRFFLDFDESGAGDAHARRDLDIELRRAAVRAPAEIPPDVVTMNSRVRLTDLDTGAELVYTLVYPPQADYAAGKISILAPIGTALLGERVGSVIRWQVPSGWRQLRVEELLYQPEAAGDFEL